MNQGSTERGNLGCKVRVSVRVARAHESEFFPSPACAHGRAHAHGRDHVLRLGTHHGGESGGGHARGLEARSQVREFRVVGGFPPVWPFCRRTRCLALESAQRTVATRAHPCGTREGSAGSACTTAVGLVAAVPLLPSPPHDGRWFRRRWRKQRRCGAPVSHTPDTAFFSLLRSAMPAPRR